MKMVESISEPSSSPDHIAFDKINNYHIERIRNAMNALMPQRRFAKRRGTELMR